MVCLSDSLMRLCGLPLVDKSPQSSVESSSVASVLTDHCSLTQSSIACTCNTTVCPAASQQFVHNAADLGRHGGAHLTQVAVLGCCHIGCVSSASCCIKHVWLAGCLHTHFSCTAILTHPALPRTAKAH